SNCDVGFGFFYFNFDFNALWFLFSALLLLVNFKVLRYILFSLATKILIDWRVGSFYMIVAIDDAGKIYRIQCKLLYRGSIFKRKLFYSVAAALTLPVIVLALISPKIIITF
ncbi:hypothetical protein L9F63_017290, partial [Diploptera punctata]